MTIIHGTVIDGHPLRLGVATVGQEIAKSLVSGVVVVLVIDEVEDRTLVDNMIVDGIENVLQLLLGMAKANNFCFCYLDLIFATFRTYCTPHSCFHPIRFPMYYQTVPLIM